MFFPNKLFQPSLTNILAYNKISSITDKKSFVTLKPWANVIKHFSFVTSFEAK
jgi:hypothetical protein